MLVFTACDGLPSPVNHGFPGLQIHWNHWLQNEPFVEGHVDQQTVLDEQLVMERSGHHSTEGVRSYKRTSDEQRRALSDIFNGTRKTARTTIDYPEY